MILSFILILLGFILVVTLLLLENRRDNIRLKEINQKVKDLIAGDYSQVLDLQGSTEITNITNNLNDLSEVIRLTQENLEQESKRLNSILSYMTDGVLADQSPWPDYYDQRYGQETARCAERRCSE